MSRNDPTMQHFHSWAEANNVKLLLCIYNGESFWDWNLARGAFKNTTATFVASFLAELNRLTALGQGVELRNLTGELLASAGIGGSAARSGVFELAPPAGWSAGTYVVRLQGEGWSQARTLTWSGR
jgi:hypothetical protein